MKYSFLTDKSPPTPFFKGLSSNYLVYNPWDDPQVKYVPLTPCEQQISLESLRQDYLNYVATSRLVSESNTSLT